MLGLARGCIGLVMIVALFGGCTVQQGDSGVLLDEIAVASLGPTPVLPGTRLMIEGSGFVPNVVAQMTVTFEGVVEGREVAFSVYPDWESSSLISMLISGDIQDALMGTNPQMLTASAAFDGALTVRRAATGSEPERVVKASGVRIPLAAILGPTLDAVTPLSVRVGDIIVIEGSGFLHPSEGVSLVSFEGEFEAQSPPAVLPITGLVIPANAPEPMRRSRLELPLTPDLFGVRSGTFRGTVRVRNELFSGLVATSSALELSTFTVAVPEVTLVTPVAASRGQRVDVHGLGLLPTDGFLEAGSLFVLEGDFTPSRGPVESWVGDNVRALFPDFHEGNTLAGVVLRATKEQDGSLGGFGFIPGRFDGVMTPIVFFGKESIVGLGRTLVFDVLPPRQMIYLKFLPAFEDALVRFGLSVERRAIEERILEVLVRDYEGINIGFSNSPPEGYVEYGIVEIGGSDPNGSGLFGLDNTAGKDVGNERFDDVIGGFNADTRAQGYAAYGGIFASELLNLSPTLSDSPLSSPRFDDIFADFVPELGGIAAGAGEMASEGERSTALKAATTILGNLIGNTVAHEIGHSLGLSAEAGEFHNLGDSGPYLMDAGVYRPFEERAEIDGYMPAIFSPANKEYLELVLPIVL
ncbi:MAG: hypothetical protein ACPGU1_09280 [Myxococcota bacterium]